MYNIHREYVVFDVTDRLAARSESLPVHGNKETAPRDQTISVQMTRKLPKIRDFFKEREPLIAGDGQCSATGSEIRVA